jgi:hypothetical protein
VHHAQDFNYIAEAIYNPTDELAKGFRADHRLKLVFKNIKLAIDPASFKWGEVKRTGVCDPMVFDSAHLENYDVRACMHHPHLCGATCRSVLLE